MTLRAGSNLKEGSNKRSYFERLKQRIVRRAPSTIGDSAGAGTGAVVGLGLGGPLGAVGGAFVGSVIGGEVEDILHRALSKQERTRINMLTKYLIKKIENNIAIGLEIRDDDFVLDSHISRSSAKEITEGLYIAAKEDHEEKKLPYYGNLLSNILFHPEIDRFQANLFVRVFEDLSYRQLCIMTLIAHKNEFSLRVEGYGNEGPKYDIKLISILQEIKNLVFQDLACTEDGIIISPIAVQPAKMMLQGNGLVIYKLAELDDLYRNFYDELKSIAELLR